MEEEYEKNRFTDAFKWIGIADKMISMGKAEEERISVMQRSKKFYLGCDSSSDYTACAIYTEFNELLEKEYKNDIRSAVKHVEELNSAETDPYENEYKDLEVKIVLVNDEWTVQKFECSVPRYVNGKQSDMLNAFVDKCCIMDYH